MFVESVIRFSQSVSESVIIVAVVVFSLRLFLRFACFLASRPWRRYRTFTISRRKWMKKTAEEDHSPPYCTVCLEDAAEGEKMRRITACGHCFHADCIDPWLEKRSTCPLCRAEIPPVPLGNPLIALFLPPGVIELFTKGTFASDSFCRFILWRCSHEESLYFEAQRSGKLPSNQRVNWRGDSALRDGSDAHIDLTGGYYDAGDNMKFGFPLAFTTTMLAWSSVEMASQLKAHGEHENALVALKWATDYLIKAHPEPNVLYGQVGDGNLDHACSMRPEDMTTPRPSYRIDAQHPGADLAGETSAAMAAASLAFAPSDAVYAITLIDHAKDLFEFGKDYPGTYQCSIPNAGGFYPSSGFEDELLWAAAWLHRATGDQTYLDYLIQGSSSGGARYVFAWDDKFLGAQVLVAKLVFEGKVKNEGKIAEYKSMAEQFICNIAQKGSSNVKKTPGGLLWFLPWDSLQYIAIASFVLATYAKYIEAAQTSVQCPNGGFLQASDLLYFARTQVDYILGLNPKNMSYMVGFGTNYPKRPHHRSASIVSIKNYPKPVTCNEGFEAWYNNPNPNPNVLVGAIVGGPNENDAYEDERSDFQHDEPDTVTVAPLVGVLAAIA